MIGWALGAAMAAAGSVWAATAPCRAHPALRRAEPSWDVIPSPTLVLGMLAVVIRQGASIPAALDEVGAVVSGGLGQELRQAAELLRRGHPWRGTWSIPCDGEGRDGACCRAIRDALEDAWVHGSSPVERLQVAIERWDADERATLERHAAGLSVRLLMPTGLCFLPAFIGIGVIPCVVSFLA